MAAEEDDTLPAVIRARHEPRGADHDRTLEDFIRGSEAERVWAWRAALRRGPS